jgi:hypothetical protein
MYENMRNFTAPYEFKEFPKWVDGPDGKQVLVQSAEEEASIAESFGSESDRDALLQQAKDLGLTPHHKLGVEKLRAMIEAAKG